MGLDMYLNSVPKVKSTDELEKLQERLTIAYFKDKLQEELKSIQKEKNFIYDIPFSLSPYINKENYAECLKEYSYKVDVSMKLGYWRKFNALHAWFVKNVQKEVDDCGIYIVTKLQLEGLYEELKSINKDNAENILPNQKGFFFGGTEYDEYYWKEIEYLKGFLIYVLTQVDERERTLIYSSSW